MAQAQNSTNTQSNSQKTNSKNHFKQKNVPSGVKQQKATQPTSPNKQTRNEKRKRWAKKHKPTPKPVVKLGPVNEYVTKCCGALGRKPNAGEKAMDKNPESGKLEKSSKGLGKWRCTVCGKSAKVSPRKPVEVKNETPVASFISPTNVI